MLGQGVEIAGVYNFAARFGESDFVCQQDQSGEYVRIGGGTRRIIQLIYICPNVARTTP